MTRSYGDKNWYCRDCGACYGDEVDLCVNCRLPRRPGIWPECADCGLARTQDPSVRARDDLGGIYCGDCYSAKLSDPGRERVLDYAEIGQALLEMLATLPADETLEISTDYQGRAYATTQSDSVTPATDKLLALLRRGNAAPTVADGPFSPMFIGIAKRLGQRYSGGG